MMEKIDSKMEIGFHSIYGEWVTENGTEFRIFGGKGVCFITFHKIYTYGKKKGEIKHFINNMGEGNFYFEMEKAFYELIFMKEKDTIVLKACSYSSRKKYQKNLPQL